MKKINVNSTKGYVALSDKRIVSFNPPAYGLLMRNVFTGEYIIAENTRAIPVTFEQAENLIEINFANYFSNHLS